MKKILLLAVVMVCAGCTGLEFLNELFTQTVDPVTGAVVTPAPIEQWTGLLGLFGPIGVGAGILVRTIVREKKTVRALYESTDHAIKSGSLNEVDFKEALALGQRVHGDSKLLEAQYKKYKKTKV